MKVGLSITLNRLDNIRNILKENSGININSLSKITKIPPTTISFYLTKYFKENVNVTKYGKEKRIVLTNKSKTREETNLINRKEKFYIMENLRKKGLTYSEIKREIQAKGYYVADGQISENLKNVKIDENFVARYHNKILGDRRIAGKIGGKIRLSMKDFKDFQLSGTEAIQRKALQRIPESSKQITNEKIWIIGHCIFDGSVINKNGYCAIAYTNKSQYLINEFKKNMLKVYNLNPTDLRRREDNIYVIRYCSIAAVNDINPSVKKEIPKFIMEAHIDRKILFLKTFWDDEGTVHFGSHKDKKGYIHISRYVEAFCENNTIRNQLIKLHGDVGLNIKEYKKKIRISTKGDFEKFAKTLGFSRGIYLSYPKSKFHGVEKAKILKIAIDSYNPQC